MWAVARRPKWIAVLLLAIAVAGAFAALGRWQLERAVIEATPDDRPTEMVVPLDSVVDPQQPLRAEAPGQRVEVTGTFRPADTTVLEGRVNGDAEGSWLVGHLIVDGTGASLPVALGWAATYDEVDAVRDAVPTASVTLVGRFQPGESPQEVDYEDGVRAMSPAVFVNEWQTTGIYAGYLVVDEPVAGLAVIDSSAPLAESSFNWLNLFYAAEWVLFAGFAIYLWYRLVKDAWEREEYDRAEADAAARSQLN